MNKGLYFLFILFLTPHFIKSQTIPKEGDKLNYRLIGFLFPPAQQVNKYTLEIASGNYNDENSFQNNIIEKVNSQNNKTITDVPSFGAQYTWRVVYDKNGKTINSPFHHFSTIMFDDVDTNLTRLRIFKKAETYKDAYVFLDASKTLYDMNGRPLWHLPDINGAAIQARDLKISPQGTITLLLGNDAFEINYHGDVLWKAPNNGRVNGDTSEFYHHQFNRLDNGNYLVLGNESVPWLPAMDMENNPPVSAAAKMKTDSTEKINQKSL